MVSALRAKVVAGIAFAAFWLLGAALSVFSRDFAVAGLWLAVGTGATLISNTAYAVGLARYAVVTLAAASLISWAIPLGLVSSGEVDTLTGYMAALGIGALARLALSLGWLLRPLLGNGLRSGAHPWLLESVRGHLGVVGYSVSNQVLARHGDIFVASLAGVSASVIGVYGLAYQIATTCNQFLLLGIGAVGLSRLSEQRNDVSKLAASWRGLSVAASILAFGPLALIVLVAPEIQALLFGDQYESLAHLLQVLAVVQWVIRVAGGGTNIMALLALGRMGFVGSSAVLGAVLNIVLGLVGAFVWGIYGIAVASAVAGVVVGTRNMAQVVAICEGDDRVRLSRLLTSPWVPRRHLVGLSVGIATACLIAQTGSGPARLSVAGGLLAVWGFMCLRTVQRERA